MDVRELRIGNWVTHLPSKNKSTNAYFIVSDIDAFKKELINGLDADDCEPIPLTEEWLVRFGFERIKNTFIDGYVFCMFDIVWFNKSYVCTNAFSPNKSSPTKIKHVHQLQNLYFALTGEELRLKNNEK